MQNIDFGITRGATDGDSLSSLAACHQCRVFLKMQVPQHHPTLLPYDPMFP